MDEQQISVLITGASAARRVNLARETFASRAKKLGIAPDAILVNGAGLGDSQLYRLDRMSEIRRALLGAHKEVA